MSQQKAGQMGSLLQWMLFLMFGAILLVGLYGWYRQSLWKPIYAKLDDIRKKEGLPANLFQFNQWYSQWQLQLDENAASVFLQAFSRYDKEYEESMSLLPLVGEGEIPPDGKPMDKEMKENIARYLARNEEALKLLHQGASMKDCRYPIDWTPGYLTLLPHMTEIQQGVNLLSLQALNYAEEGKSGLAFQSFMASRKLACSIAHEPHICSQFVAMGATRKNIFVLWHLLSRIQWSEEELVRLGGLWNLDNQEALLWALRCERCMGVNLFERLEEQSNQFDVHVPKGFYLFLYNAMGLREKDYLYFLQRMDAYLGVVQSDLLESLRIAEKLGEDDRAGVEKNRSFLSAQIFAPIPILLRERVNYMAWQRLATLGLALERYRLKNSQLPDQLAALVPAYLTEIPKDPWDDKSLRYKKSDTGYMLYSVGANGKDDGGKKPTPGMFPVDGDMIFPVAVKEQR